MKKLYELTASEWLHVRALRGQTATGFPLHKHKKYYFWSWGLQPEDDVLRKIARQCPLKAAEAFLRVYEKGGDAYGKPRKK